jgi:hypothetical protein
MLLLPALHAVTIKVKAYLNENRQVRAARGNRSPNMKTRSWLLAIAAAISGLAMLANPAQADGKKHHRHHYWEDEGRYRYYDRAWDNRGYRYYRPYYRNYDREPYYYGSDYNRGPVFEFRFRSN